jgi:hypothetical protein
MDPPWQARDHPRICPECERLIPPTLYIQHQLTEHDRLSRFEEYHRDVCEAFLHRCFCPVEAYREEAESVLAVAFACSAPPVKKGNPPLFGKQNH